MNFTKEALLWVAGLEIVIGFCLGFFFKGCVTPKPEPVKQEQFHFEGKPEFKTEIKNPPHPAIGGQAKTEGVLTKKIENRKNLNVTTNNKSDEFELPFSFDADTAKENSKLKIQDSEVWHTAEYTDTTTGITVYAKSLMYLPADLILGAYGTKLQPTEPCDESWLNSFEAGYIAGNLQWLVVAILFLIKVF